jgi:hypothetical protein
VRRGRIGRIERYRSIGGVWACGLSRTFEELGFGEGESGTWDFGTTTRLRLRRRRRGPGDWRFGEDSPSACVLGLCLLPLVLCGGG